MRGGHRTGQIQIVMIREAIANTFISIGRSFGRMTGLQLAVEVSDHSIKASMEQPDRSDRAWDQGLYTSGNLFVAGYANPIKPRVDQHDELETPDEVQPDEGDTAVEDDQHLALISSARYRKFLRQHLIDQLLTPESRWNLLVWGILGVAVLQFLTIIVTLWATGSFQ